MNASTETGGRGASRVPYPTPLWMRLLSLALAFGLSGLILVFPRTIAENAAEVRHIALTLLMWGIGAGFVHGVGFVPRMSIGRITFHPLIGGVLMASGILWILAGG